MLVTVITFIGAVLSGLISGILINYCADVLPRNRRFTAPVCQNCGSEQKNFHFLIIPKKCSQCQTPRNIRTWFVEILMIFSSVYLFYWGNGRLSYLPGLVVLTYFGIVATIDIEHRLILHPVSIIGIVLGAIVGVWLHGPLNTILGGLVGFGTMLALYALGLLYVRLRYGAESGVDGAEISYGDALGFGDVNLGGVLGLLAGWPAIILALILAIILAGFVSVVAVGVMLLRRDYQGDFAIPYGPFLISGAVLVLFFGDVLRNFYGT